MSSTSGDNPKLREILDQAAELPADRRPGFLDTACAGDAPLRAEVESLLAALGDSADFLNNPTVSATPATENPLDKIGTNIGPYRLVEKIGEGGMGVVYLAEQDKPVRRRVALKIIKPGMDTAAVIARFEAERQALALMDHSNIARVYDAGTTPQGRPYFVMELVQGLAVTKYCDQNRLTPEQRLELFIPICQAVQHAHQKGIIHRDLKPSNVLVTVQDGRPAAKVIDFGIAKAIHQSLVERSAFTQMGMIIGTPEYMSPEQAGANPESVDTRSDIYALGVILYELLTGSTPLDRRQLREAGYEQMMRTIREAEPPRPSTRLSTAGEATATSAALRRMEPKKLAKMLVGDLDVIVMKCLEKERSRRYDTATGLARDIQRYLDGDPVEATRPSSVYILGKLAWKYRRPLTAVVAFAVLTVAFLATTSVVFWVLRNEATRQRDVALQERTAAEKAQAAADTARQAEIISRNEAVQQKDRAERARSTAESETYAASIYAASAAVNFDNLADADFFLNDAPLRLRNWEWRYLNAAANPQVLSLPVGVGYQRDGQLVRLYGTPGVRETSIQFLDANTGRVTRTIEKFDGPQPMPLAISPDGTQVLLVNPESLWATVGMSPVILKLDTNQRVPLKLTHQKEFNERMFYYYTWRFSPDGKQLVTTSWDSEVTHKPDSSVRVWDTATGEYLFNLAGHMGLVIDTQFSRDGSRLVTGDVFGVSKVWDMASRTCIATYSDPVRSDICSALSPDGRRVLSAVADPHRQGVIWDLDPRSPTGVGKVLTLREGMHLSYNLARAWSPDGKLVAIGGGMFATIIDSQTGHALNILRGHSGRVCGVDFSPDGKHILTGSNDNTTRIWPVNPPPPHPLVLGSLDQQVESADFSPDSESVVTHFRDGTVRTWDIATGSARLTLDGRSMKTEAGHLPPDASATHIAVPASDGMMWVCDAATGSVVCRIGDPLPGTQVTAVAFTADDRAITGSSIGTIRVWDLATGKAVGTLQLAGPAVTDLRLSPTGECVATWGAPDEVLLWDIRPSHLRDAASGKPLCRLHHNLHARDPIYDFAFSRDGKRMVTGSGDRTAVVWDLAASLAAVGPTIPVPPQIANMIVHHSPVLSVAFNPDATRVVLSCYDEIAEVWDVSSSSRISLLRGHEGPLNSACFSPDGMRILTASKDGTARIWSAEDLSPGQPLVEPRGLLTLRGHTAEVTSAIFSPDGSKILTIAADGTARVWDSVSARQREDKLYGNTDSASAAGTK
jgi:WD40 repeat protein/serine/threonine protein kinase